MEEQAQLSVWPQSYRKYNLFVINERWGIRKNTVSTAPAVIVHRCTVGTVGNVHDLRRVTTDVIPVVHSYLMKYRHYGCYVLVMSTISTG